MPERDPVEGAHGSAIVLCAGPINDTHLPVGTNVTNAMVPINGRPVVGWILDDLLGKGIDQVAVVIRDDDDRCRKFLQRAFEGRMDLRIALMSGGTIVDSVAAGLDVLGPEVTSVGPVRIILGDTLVRDPFERDEDFVYVAAVEDSSRWCLVVTDAEGHATDYIDKQALIPGDKCALVGYYHLLDGVAVRASVAAVVADGGRDLSSVLVHYGQASPLTTVEASEWFDFGHIDGMVSARRRLIQSRSFNEFEIDPILNTITKVSGFEALADELRWYEAIPDSLKMLAPRIVESREVDGLWRVVQEYYGYPSLSELYVYGDISPETWMSILRHLIRIHEEFRRYPGSVDPEAASSMYVDKTWKRLAEVREQSPGWIDLLDRDEISYNGQSLKGFAALESKIRARAESLAGNVTPMIIHGDFCLSNILYDITNQIVRLVDPRGSFGTDGIFGDGRYDIAKLRHSVRGLYDFLVTDMFKLTHTSDGILAETYEDPATEIVGDFLDEMIVATGYDLEEIAFIEGLLFLSMLPLHADRPERQEMMYLTGITRMNEVLG